MCGPSATIVLGNHSLSLATTRRALMRRIDAAGAAIDRLRAVAVLEAVVDLAFVAVRQLAGNAAKEDAAVEVRGVADAFQLQDEVAELLRPIRCSRGRCW